MTEADHYKLLNAFDSLLADTTQGRHQQLPHGVVAPAPEYTEENTSNVPVPASRVASGGTSQLSPQLWRGTPSPSSQFDSSFFRSGNFSALQGFGGGRTAGTPNSRASSSASSVVSEGRLGSAVPPSRLAPLGSSTGLGSSPGVEMGNPDDAHASSNLLFAARSGTHHPEQQQQPIKAHRSLLGLLTSKLRRQPTIVESPRPHSVPVDIEDFQRHCAGSESLVIHGDDEDGCPPKAHTSSGKHGRPATTGETDVTPRTSGGVPKGYQQPRRAANGEGPRGRQDVIIDQQSAIDKEMEEIHKLQAQRELDRMRREQERAERRKRRDVAEHPEEEPSPSRSLEDAPPPQRTIEDERQSLLELIRQDFLLLVETQAASLESMMMQERKVFRELVRDFAFTKEKIEIAEEAEHQRRVQAIRERSRLEDRYRDERERQRRWEIVRDTVVDEEQAREELDEVASKSWEAALRRFYQSMDEPLMDTQVEERLMRCEHFESLEAEAFSAIEREWLLDLERLFRRRIERTCASLTSTQLTVPIMMYNRFCGLTILEQQHRRQILVGNEIAHNVMWEAFCEMIHPLLNRALWKLEMRETDGRVFLERDEQEGGVAVFHGCSSSRELVSRYAAVVRETKLRQAQHREEAIEDILEDELAERILSQRDEREAFILVEEMWRRGIDSIRANLKKIQIQQSMDAAEALRRAEIQHAVIEEERQRAAREAVNQKRAPGRAAAEATTTRRGSQPVRGDSASSHGRPAAASRAPIVKK